MHLPMLAGRICRFALLNAPPPFNIPMFKNIIMKNVSGNMSVNTNMSPTITVTAAINVTTSNTSTGPSRNNSLSTIPAVQRTETIKSSPLSSNQRGRSPHVMTALSPSTSIPLVSSTSTVSPGKPGGSDEDSEPKVKLYRWELVLICCGAFVFILFIIIGLLCVSNYISI